MTISCQWLHNLLKGTELPRASIYLSVCSLWEYISSKGSVQHLQASETQEREGPVIPVTFIKEK